MEPRLLGACLIGAFGWLSSGCDGDVAAEPGVGDPCIPEAEFNPKFTQSLSEELVIDTNSRECETGVCLSHYFRGRVSCPFGNAARGQQLTGGQCKPVPGKRGLFTLTGEFSGDLSTLCCPIPGDLELRPVNERVDAQCEKRSADDAVYCSCRCDVPDDPEIDRSKTSLCACPTGFTCKPLCDQHNGNCSLIEKSKWGSYCVKNGPLGADLVPGAGPCGNELHP